jgi:hypothetical protein
LKEDRAVKTLTAMLCALSFALFAVSPIAFSQEKKEPSPAQKKQQERMKDCNERAGAKKMEGDERKKFMSSCLKGETGTADKGGKKTAQQNKMTTCNKQAGDKKMKGDERKKFMSECLKG